jgi:CRISPR-associated protein Cpf1
LPKFITNISVYDKNKNNLQYELKKKKKELNLPENLKCYFNLNNYSKFITQSGIDFFNLIIGGKTVKL